MLAFRRRVADGGGCIRALCRRIAVSLSQNNREARGLKLLREWLSPEQRAQFEAARYFDVVGCDTGKKYRIHYGSSMNIDELDDRGQARVSYCLIADRPLVRGDVVLAQKIALETDERASLRRARRMTPRKRSSLLGVPLH